MTVNDFFTSVEPALTFLPNDENCWSDTIFSVEVSPGATVPDQLLTVELDDIGVFSFTVDSVDQVGDHLISITASDGLLTSANSTQVFSVHVESPNALPDLCQDASSLYLEEKENEQAADLPDEAIEITVGQDTVQVGVPSIAIASLTSIEDVDTLCAPVDYTLVVEDENGDIIPE